MEFSPDLMEISFQPKERPFVRESGKAGSEARHKIHHTAKKSCSLKGRHTQPQGAVFHDTP